MPAGRSQIFDGYRVTVEPKSWHKRWFGPSRAFFAENVNYTFRVRVEVASPGAAGSLEVPFRVLFSNGKGRALETMEVSSLANERRHGYLQDIYVPVPGRTQIVVPGNDRWWSLFAFDVVTEASVWKFVLGPVIGLLSGVAGGVLLALLV